MKNSDRSRVLNQLAGGAAVAVLAMLVAGGHLARCQFLQPQSHLGRLVQSIASPLVLSSGLGGGGDSSDSYDPELASQSRPDEPNASQFQPEAAGQHYQHYQRQPEASRDGRQQQQQQQHYHAGGGLQQAPSQQRGVPQRYYGGSSSDDDDSPPAGAPSNHGHQQPAMANEQYQMGAYLGPTIDDKEIQGAFNSNDERDDDDSPGYDGPPAGRQAAGANAYAASQPESSGGYAPMASAGPGGYGPMAAAGPYTGADAGGPAARGRDDRRAASFDDDSSADEDDEPAPRRRQPRFRSSMSQAASQYHQRQNRYPGGQQQQGHAAPMMAAANGYSPMGASGPFDLSSLMAAAAGGPGNGQAYEVYNGDGSYPGYYPQQQQQGRRNQAASMNNPYGYQNDGYASQNGPPANGQRERDNDDADADADED
jgi:hypothetical protein